MYRRQPRSTLFPYTTLFRSLQQADVRVVEEVRLRGFQVKHPNQSAFEHQGNRQLRSYRRERRNVRGIVVNVVHQNRASSLRRTAHNSLAHFDTQVLHQLLGMALAEMHAQLLRLLIEQKYSEDLIVNGALDDLRDTAQQLIEIESGV